MKKFLGFIITPFIYLEFGLILIYFHIAQVLALNFKGETARRKQVGYLYKALVAGLYPLGTKITVKGTEKIPKEGPIIIVSNHQSLSDIPAIGRAFNQHFSRYISKIELGKNIPSISYNLVKSESALIDRSNPRQSISEIVKIGKKTEQEKATLCIFPEGTRSKDGKVKEFQAAGIQTLAKTCPSAVFVPFAIKGHSEIIGCSKFCFGVGAKVEYEVLDPIKVSDMPIKELIKKLENDIRVVVEA